ncbi:FAD-binding oxidoreductase [Pseudomaricurvus sp. HS19]|uniref:NAD(P)/FAD-dependent oxidoreductase n=1 Tax=Pseudomaricurvus sp. HS19 TaxID=2692626 RepID=UPI0013688465|nr:FAD-binding oxidoreductase [Pseudomaricurvus sp. HS19]MYM64821.1 FAD-dependent oxidoreductase [Pseudomaricurvus sp. HS19]
MLNPGTHSTNYPESYYHATLNDRAGFDQLQGDVSAQVCVIGGGFSGVNTALELAERGFDVVLLEAYKIGWGASGRNGGQMIRGIGHGLEQFRNNIGQQGIDAIEQMGFEAVDIVLDRIKQHSIDCDLVMGHACLAMKPRHMQAFREEKAHLDSIGYAYDVHIIEQPEMHTLVGSDCYQGALLDMGSGHLHPLNLVVGEARAAQQQGVRIFENARVEEIDESNGFTVRTASGSVRAEQLVVCANAYVRGLDDVLEATVLPAGSYVMATEPLPEEVQKRLLPTNAAVADERIALDYYRLSSDGRMIFGGLCTYSGRDPKSIIAALKPNMDKVFPELRNTRIDYQWGGLIGIGANRLPQIGRLRENLYYAQAYAGHGLAASHLAGRVIAEAINGDDSRLSIYEKVKHMRFPGGPRFRSPLLALGMSYHRFMDLF